jgi:hypothetical protein
MRSRSHSASRRAFVWIAISKLPIVPVTAYNDFRMALPAPDIMGGQQPLSANPVHANSGDV